MSQCVSFPSKPCLNEELSWDGTVLGTYSNISQWSWKVGERMYHALDLPQGIVYCLLKKRNSFSLLVYHLTLLFKLIPRRLHQIKIDNTWYIAYYVPYRHGFVIYENVLTHIPLHHSLRQRQETVQEIRKIIVFCDLLALRNTREGSIIIRDEIYPILTNDCETTLLHEERSYDGDVLPRSLFERWFGEKVSFETVALDLILQATKEKNIPCALHTLRHEIDRLLTVHDKNYVWYSNCILDRCARHILKHDEFFTTE